MDPFTEARIVTAMRQSVLAVVMIVLTLTAGPLVLLGWPLQRTGKALVMSAIRLVTCDDRFRAWLFQERE